MSGETPSADGPSDAVHAYRVLSLPQDPASPRVARALLREVLAAADGEGWLESAELACTELVTNALLHAHTGVVLTIDVRPDVLLVEVADSSPELPTQRPLDRSATTGRGMSLVAALTSDHGVRDAGPQGKTVWFEIGAQPSAGPEEDLLAAWADDGWDSPEPPHGGSVGDRGAAAADVGATALAATLLGLPPGLWLAAEQHHDTLLRELVLYRAEHDDERVDMRATDGARTLLSGVVHEAVEASRRAGTSRSALPHGHPGWLPWVPGPLDLQLRVPADVVPGFAAMQDALDLAERLAVEGQLLARPGLPEIVAVRDWACEQVLAQHAGAPPIPWTGTDDDRFTAASAGTALERPIEWDLAAVQSHTRAVVAADDTNRIVAVSPALGELVGWDVADLVGRRVVTLIPPWLREGHVAGFSRHLSTGEAHLIGMTLTLPVLHADGSELLCRVLIDEAVAIRGRRLYLAWFDEIPVGEPTG